jgi:hypothetical protein
MSDLEAATLPMLIPKQRKVRRIIKVELFMLEFEDKEPA